MGRPSDNMQPSGKRRPGEQLTKDTCDESDDEGQDADLGTWGKADAATMARRKVIKVRRGGAPGVADQAAAAEGSNPFAGVSLSTAAQPVNPFAGVSLTAATPAKADEGDGKGVELCPKAVNVSLSATQATSADHEQHPASAAPVAGPADLAAAADNGNVAAAELAKPAAAALDPAGEQQCNLKEPQEFKGKTDSKADSIGVDQTAAAPSSTGFGGFSSTSAGGFGGFGGFGSIAAGTGSFGGGGFGGFAAAASKDSSSAGGSLFSSFNPPQPGSLFGAGFAAGAAGKGKDVEEGAAVGEEAGDDNGKEVFGGPEIAPVVQLSEVPKQTGEEDEDSVFSAEGKLFEFVDGKDWRERGRGDLRLNVHRTSQKGRLVMRQKGSQRLLLNANLFPKMTTSQMVGGKGATFAAVNAAPPVPSDGSGKGDQNAQDDACTSAEAASAAASMKTYAFKAKSAGEIAAFLAAVDRYKQERPDAEAAKAQEGGNPTNPDSW